MVACPLIFPVRVRSGKNFLSAPQTPIRKKGLYIGAEKKKDVVFLFQKSLNFPLTVQKTSSQKEKKGGGEVWTEAKKILIFFFFQKSIFKILVFLLVKAPKILILFKLGFFNLARLGKNNLKGYFLDGLGGVCRKKPQFKKNPGIYIEGGNWGWFFFLYFFNGRDGKGTDMMPAYAMALYTNKFFSGPDGEFFSKEY